MLSPSIETSYRREVTTVNHPQKIQGSSEAREMHGRCKTAAASAPHGQSDGRITRRIARTNQTARDPRARRLIPDHAAGRPVNDQSTTSQRPVNAQRHLAMPRIIASGGAFSRPCGRWRGPEAESASFITRLSPRPPCLCRVSSAVSFLSLLLLTFAVYRLVFPIVAAIARRHSFIQPSSHAQLQASLTSSLLGQLLLGPLPSFRRPLSCFTQQTGARHLHNNAGSLVNSLSFVLYFHMTLSFASHHDQTSSTTTTTIDLTRPRHQSKLSSTHGLLSSQTHTRHNGNTNITYPRLGRVGG